MRRIFGLLSRDERPIDPDHLRAMSESAGFALPAREAIWNGQQVGFAWTPEPTRTDVHASDAPSIDSRTGVVVIGVARIDNAQELAESLRLDRTSAHRFGGALLLEAYLRWGED